MFLGLIHGVVHINFAFTCSDWRNIVRIDYRPANEEVLRSKKLKKTKDARMASFQFPIATGKKKAVKVFECPTESWKERAPRVARVRCR